MRHELRGAVAFDFDFAPVRQVVRVGIGVVNEAAMLDDEAARVRTVAAGVPAERRGGEKASGLPSLRRCARSVASSTV
jgi:hypothetical protein